MNPNLDRLQPYPFQKLRNLLEGVTPAQGQSLIDLTIGEPKHPTPEFISAAVRQGLEGLASYPQTRGTAELRQAIADWLTRRFRLGEGAIDPDTAILPVNGTREGLFAIAQTCITPGNGQLVLMPNPFYQIYEGAALLAGAEPCYLACNADNGYIPDYPAIPETQWQRCRLLYLCSPGNPTGAITPAPVLKQLIELAHRHDFILISDECYSEIYNDERHPPPGLLQAAWEMGNSDFSRCLVFNSLSKRSSVPGLRSGFVAGDRHLIESFFLYRTYHGCAMPPHHQSASTLAWRDEAHVRANRALYRGKLEAVHDILYDVLPMAAPEAGFYLWPETPIPETEFARRLLQQENVKVLPGSFLSRECDNHNPGRNRLRLALVAPHDECVEAAHRIRRFTESLL